MRATLRDARLFLSGRLIYMVVGLVKIHEDVDDDGGNDVDESLGTKTPLARFVIIPLCYLLSLFSSARPTHIFSLHSVKQC